MEHSISVFHPPSYSIYLSLQSKLRPSLHFWDSVNVDYSLLSLDYSLLSLDYSLLPNRPAIQSNIRFAFFPVYPVTFIYHIWKNLDSLFNLIYSLLPDHPAIQSNIKLDFKKVYYYCINYH